MSHIFNRLAIGTAAWGKEYNGVKVSEDEQKAILDYCQCSGIDMIDTATAYGWDWTKANSYFCINLKVKIRDAITTLNLERVNLMAHNIDEYPRMYKYVKGASIYEPLERQNIYGGSVIQIPYSIFDRRFEPYLESMHECNEIHVRSIFLRGKLLEKFKPWECIAFCLANPYIDRIIIGVDSLQQLRDNLRLFHRMNSAEVHDENILDVRKWEEEK